MAKICREAEASIDYYSLFKAIMKRTPLPMTPLESLASSAVRTAHKVQASLVVVLTRGGATARLVAKYRPTGECPVVLLGFVGPGRVCVCVCVVCARPSARRLRGRCGQAACRAIGAVGCSVEVGRHESHMPGLHRLDMLQMIAQLAPSAPPTRPRSLHPGAAP